MNKLCPPDKVLNPKTSRCVLKTGAIGKKILKASHKCADPEKVFNHRTGRCVSKKSKLGKSIIEKATSSSRKALIDGLASAPDKLENVRKYFDPCYPDKLWNWWGSCISFKHKRAKRSVKLSKMCPREKLYNPKTSRCVKRTSVLGKKLIAGDPDEQTEEGRIYKFIQSMALLWNDYFKRVQAFRQNVRRLPKCHGVPEDDMLYAKLCTVYTSILPYRKHVESIIKRVQMPRNKHNIALLLSQLKELDELHQTMKPYTKEMSLLTRKLMKKYDISTDPRIRSSGF